jgi:hypothetical protein
MMRTLVFGAVQCALWLIVGCGRLHLDAATGGSPAGVDGDSAGARVETTAGRSAAAGSGDATTARSGAAGVAAHSANVGQDGGAHESGRAGAGTAGRAVTDRGTAGAGVDDKPRADIPQLPIGITLDGDATLPEGLWVGETQSEAACPAIGGGVTEGSSRRVTLEVAPATAGAPAHGIVVFGDEQIVFPIATNPDVGYPVGDDYYDAQCRQDHASAGYPYAVRDGHVSPDGRFEFRIAVVELYDTWCGLQTSYGPGDVRFTENGYSCLPYLGNADFDLCETMSMQCPISSSKFASCQNDATCVCHPEGCYVNLDRTYRVDLQVSAQRMDGLLARPGYNDSQPSIPIKLHRVQ